MVVNEVTKATIEADSQTLENIVNDIVKSYTKELDEYVNKIKCVLDDDTDGLTEHDLNQIMIKLCSYMYFIGSKQELLGIRADISDALRDEKYNLAFMSATGTVASKESQALNAIKEEEVIKVIYDRAYKIMKNKYAAVDKWIDAIKKILSMRIKLMEIGVKGN